MVRKIILIITYFATFFNDVRCFSREFSHLPEFCPKKQNILLLLSYRKARHISFLECGGLFCSFLFVFYSFIQFFCRAKRPSNRGGWPQLVEKPAVAIKPEQVFCMKSKRTEKKEEDFLSILLVCGHPTLDGWRSISRWPAFSDSWQQI